MTKNQKILAAVAVAGAAYWLWKRNKKASMDEPIMQTRPAVVEGEPMSEALGVTRLGASSVKYGNSACSYQGKIYVACGQTCPRGTKIGGSHDRNCS